MERVERTGFMASAQRNRLALLGGLWGLLLAAVPALVMSRPFEPSVFMAVLVVCAVVAGILATVYAGFYSARRGARPKRRGSPGWLSSGFRQGLVGGAVGALAVWAVMAVEISGTSLAGGLSNLMRPSVFIGSFFVALSAFVYVLVVGVVLSPLFGTAIERFVRREPEREKT